MRLIFNTKFQYTPLGEGGKSKLFVIKIGGNIIDNKEALQSFLQSLALVRGKKILVHGGGKIATVIGDKLGIESKYINGRRITDDDTIDIVTMVYGGLINKQVTAKLQSLKCNAIGVSGADMNLIPATKRVPKALSFGAPNAFGIGEVIDFGWVGDISNKDIDAEKWTALLEKNITPVVAPLTHDGNGNILNTNADTIASSVAIALSGVYDVRLIYCFEKKGILENIEDEHSVISLITKQKYRQLLKEQKLFAGILPKIENAFAAIDAGVQEVLIGHADDLLQNIMNETKGTLIKAS